MVLAELRWELINCPLCGAADAATVQTVAGRGSLPLLRLQQCRRCTLGYLNPRPVREDLGQLYAQDYEAYQPVAEKAASWRRRLSADLERWVCRTRLGYPPPVTSPLARLVAWVLSPWFFPSRDALLAVPFTGQGRLLDYGCGSGWYLARMRARGWQVVGVDLSPFAAAVARENYGLEVHVGTLPHPCIPPASVDVVTMGQVLEHVPDPHEIIAAVTGMLRPGGRLALSVPNLASWGRRAFGPYWWPLQLPLHLLHFTPVALRQLMEQHGLAVREVRMLRMTNWMQRSFAQGEAAGWRNHPPPLPRWLGRRRLTAKLLTAWTVLSGQADGLYLLAEKRVTAATRQAA